MFKEKCNHEEISQTIARHRSSFTKHPDRVKKTVIDRADDHLDDLGDLAQEKYQSVADIVANRFRRHRDRDEDSHAFRNAVRLAAGVGVGVGLGLLFAPAADKRPGAYSPKKPRASPARSRSNDPAIAWDQKDLRGAGSEPQMAEGAEPELMPG